MKVTFIRPNIGRLESGVYIDEGRMEPLSLGVIAAYTPADVECVLYDDRMEEIPFDEPTDLAAITVELYNARRSYEIAAEYRRRGVPVVMGGFHPTLAAEECQQHADAIVTGDAELVWPTVVEDARRGRLRNRYDGTTPHPQPGGVIPRRDLYKGKGYLPISLLQFGRGCRFACDFCAISSFFDRKQTVRPVDDVLAELEQRDSNLVFFVDDNFVSSHDALKTLLRALIPLKIRWVSQGSLDMTEDDELMDLIEASGGQGLVVGFESVNQDNVKSMRKACNLSKKFSGWDRYARQVEILRRHHLQTWASFTLGHDHDTPDSIEETFRFAEDSKFCFAAFNILMPYPGTALYRRLEMEGRLLWGGKWWLHPDYRFNHAAFVPRHMSPEELTESVWGIRQRWNSARSIFKRMWDFQTHLDSPYRLGTYLVYNRLYAAEAWTKHGMFFGRKRGSIGPQIVRSDGGAGVRQRHAG
ncbi:MAG: B12-binding domain-containing radical SAM protein [Gammaproteobacteria bacterium]|nr:B12-binding domain-containing radical SAM protein [Gammaproteobacteria bacterium]